MVLSTAALRECVAVLDALNGVDPGALSPADATARLAEVGRARKALEALAVPLAGVVARASAEAAERFARAKGFASPAGLIASAGDMPLADAGRLVAVAAEPETHPVVAAAVADGSLSVEKAAIIRRCLNDMTVPTAEIEASLVKRAVRRSAADVRKMCAIELARVDQAALEERERRNRAKRYVRMWDEPDGMVGISGRLDATPAVHLRTYLDTQVRAQMIVERDEPEGVRREPQQIAADILVSMSRHVTGCADPATGVKTTIVVRVDKADLESGLGVAQCDSIEGPISVATLRAMAVDAQILPAVMGGPSIPLDLGRARRLFTPAQRLAIAERDGGCATCGAPVARCDVHHIRFWSRGGTSDLTNGVLLCVGCHHRLHDHGWEIEIDAAGRVWFVPPASIDPGRRRQPAHLTRHAV